MRKIEYFEFLFGGRPHFCTTNYNSWNCCLRSRRIPNKAALAEGLLRFQLWSGFDSVLPRSERTQGRRTTGGSKADKKGGTLGLVGWSGVKSDSSDVFF